MADGSGRHIVIPYRPRGQFLAFHNRTQRWSCIVAHRRAGKTVACVNDLIRGALLCKRERPRFAYIAPFFSQAKDVAWEYVKHFTAPLGVTPNESELRVDLPNGGRVRLYGADNYERLRGLYLDGVILDEYGDMDPRAWPEVIRPTLSDRLGWAAFIGTAKGRNHFCSEYERAVADPERLALMLKASETGLVPESELAEARKDMSEDQYAQEYECSFEAAIVGSYYGKLIAQATADKRVCRVPYDPAVKVTTAWDLGIGDSTAIWFAQQVGKEVHLIDYYESSGVGLDHYAKLLSERPYAYNDHLLPHDAAARELGSGKTRQETLESLGIRGTVLPQQAVDDGINAVRLLLPRTWIDSDKCERGLECLRQYRREYDDKRKAFRDRPLHDWTSHGADALRTLAMGLKPESPPRRPREGAREGGWMN